MTHGFLYSTTMATAALGAALFFGAYVWAFVLASRVRGGNWFLGLLFVGIVTYPILAYRHWPLMRRNCTVLLLGAALIAVSIAVLAAGRQ